jgi:two-component system response regulator DegU
LDSQVCATMNPEDGTAVRVSVLVADEHNLYAEGIAVLLKAIDAIQVVSRTSNGDEVIAAARAERPDVILMDASIPPHGGIEVTRRLREEGLTSKVLLLTRSQDEVDLAIGFRAGVNGFLSKKAGSFDMASAIAGVSRGDYVVHLSIAAPAIREYLENPGRRIHERPHEGLTPREREIFRLIADGSRTIDVADRLRISVKTVAGHRTHMMKKLGVHNQTQLIKYAIISHMTGGATASPGSCESGTTHGLGEPLAGDSHGADINVRC